ncbi:hypothetical protein R1sor_012907 [Riccia sorocarpa]|uniref:Uncharacterized protein n=1 Tax=Riccia sorocarpa TaxID=122646 RepID=A0ABD3I961_9MARC
MILQQLLWCKLQAAYVSKSDDNNVDCFTIRRVPGYVRSLESDRKRYDCRILPLGLYLRNDQDEDNEIEKLKLEVVSIFLQEFNLLERGWEDFFEQVGKSPSSGRPTRPLEHFYHDSELEMRTKGNMSSEELRAVLTFDVVFIAAFYIFRYKEFGGAAIDFFCGCPRLIHHLNAIFRRDTVWFHLENFHQDIFFLLENQVPLFMFQNVFRVPIISRRLPEFSFDGFVADIVFHTLKSSGLPHASAVGNDITFEDCDHLLACLHKVVCMDDSTTSSSHRSLSAQRLSCRGTSRKMSRASPLSVRWTEKSTMPTASELRRVGIRCRGISTGVSGIRFVKSFFRFKAKLYLPKIAIQGDTDKWLVNMCAYEWMNKEIRPKKLTVFMQIMDNLIDTEEDVQLMRRGRKDEPVIAVHHLGEDKMVAELFNNLLKNFPHADVSSFEDLKSVIDEIQVWHRSPRRRQVTSFVDRVGAEPWYVVTLLVAFVLLAVAILQTIYTVWGFYNQG